MSFLVRASPSSLFPTFLLPSLPFHRKSSTSSTSSTESGEGQPRSPDAPTQPNIEPPRSAYLGGHISYLRCGRCAADLCLTSSIVSRGFTGRWGRAYLVSPSAENHPAPSTLSTRDLNALPNTHIHRPVPRQLVTGAHMVSDVSCAFCGNVLGWKYVAADEESQRYKVGKFILETKRVCVMADWEQEEGVGAAKNFGGFSMRTSNSLEGSAILSNDAGDDTQFDSQDEDECEDLFAGVWTPQLAAKRRQSRRFSRDIK